MAEAIFDRFQVIDIDTHLTEPPDTWTSRVPKKWGDKIPHIVNHEGRDIWLVGDESIGAPGAYSMAGHTGTPPDFREGYHDIPASMSMT